MQLLVLLLLPFTAVAAVAIAIDAVAVVDAIAAVDDAVVAG